MGAILEQLGLDQTFFYQLGIFVVLFFVLSQVYFKPFLKLFEARHKKLVADKEAAEKLILDADARFEQYKQRISLERAEAKKEYDAVIEQTRKEESQILSKAREEAKKITQEAVDSVAGQRAALRKQLESDVESLAQTISEKLLSRKV